MARRSSSIPQMLLALLIFSHLIIIFSNAVPSTRTERLLLQGKEDVNEFIDHQLREGTAEEVMNARMDLEVNDYPGSGANNRHTPKPPAKD